MIDPIHSLAFSMQAHKGIYAVLLGSGVSRSARIPTGWEITIELIRKVAAIAGEDCEMDPPAWYRSRHGREPDYSELLDQLAKTPAERQQLLRKYWEPTESEREEGAKLPTSAHRSVAELVKLGYIRVIITTNIDRLQETALHELGIQPSVLSSPDHIEGAVPLIHSSCTLIKVHGDYLDTRIRNTPVELASYPASVNRLLDRVFDEFGLIVCGWSADWDEALRTAIIRSPSRRYSMYWAARSEPGHSAMDLIHRRAAAIIKISDSDAFFSSLLEQVRALEQYDRPHPLSTEAAVASTKRYLSESKYRIALADLIAQELERVVASLSQAGMENTSEAITPDSLTRRMTAVEAACTTLVQIAYVAGHWSDSAQIAPWKRALNRLVLQRGAGGYVVWLQIQRYPATLLWYAFGLGAVTARQWAILGDLAGAAVEDASTEKRAVEVAPAWAMAERSMDAYKLLPGRKDRYTPLQDHLADFLYSTLGKQFASRDEFNLEFDRLEVISALSYARRDIESGHQRYWTFPGPYAWRRNSLSRVMKEIRGSLETQGAGSQYITSGLAGRDLQVASKNISGLEQFVERLGWM